jgi:predicted DNA-binding transcriptional regulator YafY
MIAGAVSNMPYKLEKTIKLLEYLEEHKAWVKSCELCSYLDIDRRSLIRHIKEIQTAFSPFLIIESGKNGYRLDKNDFMDSVRQREDCENLAAILFTPLGGLVKPKRPYKERTLALIRDLIDIRGAAPYEILHPIFRAMKEGQYLCIEYQSIDGINKHECVPFKIFLDFSILYIILYDRDRGHLILMAVSKILSINLMPEKLEEVKCKELKDYINSAWGKMIRHDEKLISEVRFWVNESILYHFIKYPLHESQKIEVIDGERYITMRIHHPVEFIRWSLRFGQGIKIISPDEVIQEIKNYLNFMNNYYE